MAELFRMASSFLPADRHGQEQLRHTAIDLPGIGANQTRDDVDHAQDGEAADEEATTIERAEEVTNVSHKGT